MKHASESHHWYDQQGNECHKQPNKSKPGQERKTNLRDARSKSLVPSVTTILGILAKPGLDRWKINQVMMSALTLPKIDGESIYDFEKRVWVDSQEHAKQAREKGTAIHATLEAYFADGTCSDEDKPLVDAVYGAMFDTFGDQQWKAEKSFACDIGFAGKVDLHSDEVVIDFKTTEFTADKLPKGFDEQVEQLAAYAVGLGLQIGDGFNFPRCANVYISTKVDNLIHIVEWSQDQLEAGWQVFDSALKIWVSRKKYDASF